MVQAFRPKHTKGDWTSLAIFVVVIAGCVIMLWANQ